MVPENNNEDTASSLIVYWGNFGGGVRLADSLFLLAAEKNIKIYFSFSKNNESFSPHHRASALSKDFIISTPKHKLRTINFFSAYKQCNSVKKQILKKNIKQVVMLMPHPWDFILELMLKRSNITIKRCIHDATAHPGDKGIPNWYIALLSKTSSENIFFSRFVAGQFEHLNKKSTTLKLIDYRKYDQVIRDEDLILFIGRIKKYKGLDLLANAWALLDKSKMTLKIYGAGKGIPKYLVDHAQVFNRWVLESEIDNLIGSAKVIVLPYTEASQSGLISIAQNLGTNLVITPLPGLIEQLDKNSNHVISEDFTPISLAKAIKKAHLLPNIRAKEMNSSVVDILTELGGKF
jgi:glycosyltransferase involved in cell wall biosynthesis